MMYTRCILCLLKCVYFDTIWPYEGSDYVIVGGYDLYEVCMEYVGLDLSSDLLKYHMNLFNWLTFT